MLLLPACWKAAPAAAHCVVCSCLVLHGRIAAVASPAKSGPLTPAARPFSSYAPAASAASAAAAARAAAQRDTKGGAWREASRVWGERGAAPPPLVATAAPQRMREAHQQQAAVVSSPLGSSKGASLRAKALRAWATPSTASSSVITQPLTLQHPSQMNVLSSERQAAAQPGFMTGVTTVPSGQGFKKTFYKRRLPSPPSTAFASAEGRQLFAEALASGQMNGFFKLMEQFSTQDDPAFCGLASLAMVLNALAIDPRRTWKGAWRWFHEQMLDCCRPLDDIKREGITLTQAACLARCNGARVVLHRSGSFTLEEFRQQIVDACSSGEHHLVVSYTRRAFQQTGDGHFSPVGGYHAGKDLVLILDVARFKYPPHWVPLTMLYEAMKAVDPVTGQPRGFLHVSSQPLLTSVLLTLDVRSSCWQQASQWVRDAVPKALRGAAQAAAPGPCPEQLLAGLLADLPMTSLDAFLMLRHNVVPQSSGALVAALNGGSSGAAHACGDGSAGAGDHGSHQQQQEEQAGGPMGHSGDVPDRCMPVAARQQLLMELRALPLFALVQAFMSRSGQLSACTQLQCEHADVSHTHGADEGDEVLDDDPLPSAAAAAPLAATQPQQRAGEGAPLANAAGATAHVSLSAQQGQHAGGCTTSATALSKTCCQPPPDHAQLQPPHAQPQHGGAAAQGALAASQTPGGAAGAHQPGQVPPEGTVIVGGNSGYLAEKATMLLLLRGQQEAPATAWADADAGKAWAALMDTSAMSIVEAELAFLREQWAHIDEVVQSGSVEPSCGSGCSVTLDCAALKCPSGSSSSTTKGGH